VALSYQKKFGATMVANMTLISRRNGTPLLEGCNSRGEKAGKKENNGYKMHTP
jgi:hypothetical protein